MIYSTNKLQIPTCSHSQLIIYGCLDRTPWHWVSFKHNFSTCKVHHYFYWETSGVNTKMQRTSSLNYILGYNTVIMITFIQKFKTKCSEGKQYILCEEQTQKAITTSSHNVQIIKTAAWGSLTSGLIVKFHWLCLWPTASCKCSDLSFEWDMTALWLHNLTALYSSHKDNL